MLVTQFRDLQETFPHLTLQEQQLLLRAMARQVRVHPDGKVEIDFNLIAGLQVPAMPLNGYREIDLTSKAVPITPGEQLKAYREGKSMTQKDFAVFLGVNPYALCQWERGDRRMSPQSRALTEKKTGLALLPDRHEKLRVAS